MSDVKEEAALAAASAEKALPPGTEVMIDGKPRKIKYTLYSFNKLQQVTGKNPLDGSIFRDIGPSEIAALVWAGLLHESPSRDPQMEIEELSQLIEAKDIPAIGMACLQAFNIAAPSAPEVEGGKKNLEVAPTQAAPDVSPTAETPNQ